MLAEVVVPIGAPSTYIRMVKPFDFAVPVMEVFPAMYELVMVGIEGLDDLTVTLFETALNVFPGAVA